MAYTSAPESQTYSSQRVYPNWSINPRLGSASSMSSFYHTLTDGGLLNMIPIKVKDASGQQRMEAQTRPPLAGTIVTTTALEYASPRGCYVWQKTSTLTYYFAVFDTKVYTSTDGVAWSAVTTFLTSSANPVGFTEFIDATNTKKLVLVDGIEGYVFTSNAAGTKITDVDFPTPHLPYPVFIDGYLFLAKKDTGDIYNSDLNSPDLWTAGSFVSSELYPDDLQALVKINNYLVAVGNQGCEYFYDAANATASPLARQETLALPFGSLAPFTIAVNKDTMVMLANVGDGQMSLKIIEGTKTADLDCSWLLEFINYNLLSYNLTTSTLRGYFMRTGGELLYVLSIQTGVSNASTRTAFAFHLPTQTWIKLGVCVNNANANSVWPVFSTCQGSTADPVTFLVGTCDNRGFFGTFGLSKLYTSTLNANYAMDNLPSFISRIICAIETPKMDFGTLNLKFMNRMGIAASFGSPALPTFTMVYANEGYAYLTTRTVDITSEEFPFVTQLGAFRQRTFKISWAGSSPTNNYPVRLRYLEFDINKGQQ